MVYKLIDHSFWSNRSSDPLSRHITTYKKMPLGLKTVTPGAPKGAPGWQVWFPVNSTQQHIYINYIYINYIYTRYKNQTVDVFTREFYIFLRFNKDFLLIPLLHSTSSYKTRWPSQIWVVLGLHNRGKERRSIYVYYIYNILYI